MFFDIKVNERDDPFITLMFVIGMAYSILILHLSNLLSETSKLIY